MKMDKQTSLSFINFFGGSNQGPVCMLGKSPITEIFIPSVPQAVFCFQYIQIKKERKKEKKDMVLLYSPDMF